MYIQDKYVDLLPEILDVFLLQCVRPTVKEAEAKRIGQIGSQTSQAARLWQAQPHEVLLHAENKHSRI